MEALRDRYAHTHDGATEYVRIDPEDLRKALARDDVAEEPDSAAQARLDAGRRRNNARLARRKKY